MLPLKEEGYHTIFTCPSFFDSAYHQLKRIYPETELTWFNTIKITLFVSNTVNIPSKMSLQREDSNNEQVSFRLLATLKS